MWISFRDYNLIFFNFKDEKLSFKCEDLSDANYCKSNGNHGEYLSKYRKDPYRAKAYIHQMLSRCYATSVCNPIKGILNSTFIPKVNAAPATYSLRKAMATGGKSERRFASKSVGFCLFRIFYE